MEIFVINLRRSVKRRREMSAQLDRLGLSYRFFEATDGKALTEEELLQHRRQMPGQPSLTLGQIGCALSHYRVYRTMEEEGIETALILEDDLRLSPDLPRLLPRLEAELQNDELILLYFVPGRGCQITRADQVELGGEYHLRYPLSIGNVLSATAYLLRKDTARRLAATVYPIHLCADWWGAMNAEGGLARIRCVTPALIQLRAELPSEIGLGQLRNPLVRPVLDWISRHEVFPLSQILAWNRARVMAGLQSMCTLTDQPSSLVAAVPGPYTTGETHVASIEKHP
jgi:glycosyl transferase family 25